MNKDDEEWISDYLRRIDKLREEIADRLCPYPSHTERRGCTNAISLIKIVAEFPWVYPEIDILIDILEKKREDK